MPGVGNEGCGLIMPWVLWGGVWSIFQLILCEKNFLELGDPACLLDWGSAVSMLWRWMGAFVDLGVSAVGSSFKVFKGN